jgi:hypothetical protein
MEVFYEDLVGQSTVACVSFIVVASQDYCLGRCTVCLVPIDLSVCHLFVCHLSVCLHPVCLSPVRLSPVCLSLFCRSD